MNMSESSQCGCVHSFPTRFNLYQAHAFQISSRQGADQLRTLFGQIGQSEVGPELPDLFQTGEGRFRHGSDLGRTKGFLTVIYISIDRNIPGYLCFDRIILIKSRNNDRNRNRKGK
jgi:hypothetical protein